MVHCTGGAAEIDNIPGGGVRFGRRGGAKKKYPLGGPYLYFSKAGALLGRRDGPGQTSCTLTHGADVDGRDARGRTGRKCTDWPSGSRTDWAAVDGRSRRGPDGY